MSTQTTWQGFKCEEFEFEGHPANIVFPEKANEKKTWTIKTEYRDAFPETEIELLRRGFHVTYIKNTSRWATKVDCDTRARFVKYISETYGLSDKCVPVGMSCGGCNAVNFAGFYPELVACMFLDAPVLNFADLPGSFSDEFKRSVWDKEFVKAYPGIKRADLLNFDNHPISKAPILIEHKLPILMLYGTDDIVVEYRVHGQLLEEVYADHPGLLTVMKRPEEGHHPHGYPTHPETIADWIEAHI